MTPFQQATPILPTEDQQREQFAAAPVDMIRSATGLDDPTFDDYSRWLVEQCSRGDLYKNDQYQVAVYMPDENAEVGADGGDFPPMIHLSIKRLDRQPIHDWRDLQDIKNALVGREHEAVELYPAESRLTDSANQYHLWCLASPEIRFPFGFRERFTTDESSGGAIQRPGANR